MSLTNSQIITPHAPCCKTAGKHRRIKASLSLHGFIVQSFSIGDRCLALGIHSRKNAPPESTPRIEVKS